MTGKDNVGSINVDQEMEWICQGLDKHKSQQIFWALINFHRMQMNYIEEKWLLGKQRNDNKCTLRRCLSPMEQFQTLVHGVNVCTICKIFQTIQPLIMANSKHRHSENFKSSTLALSSKFLLSSHFCFSLLVAAVACTIIRWNIINPFSDLKFIEHGKYFSV